MQGEMKSMSFQVRTEERAFGSWTSAVLVLVNDAGTTRAEVLPDFGFNCWRWQAVLGGQRLDLLFGDPQHFALNVPTRSGIPILFPFPNRIRAGRFSWGGRDYQLPLNDHGNKNAIHGFACRRAWRVVEQGGGDDAAWVTGEFHAAADAPEARPLWPADYRLRVTYRLGATRLRIEAEVENPDQVALPFGLGYHPYFRVPFVGGGAAEDCTVTMPARELWQLRESLPTGKRSAPDAARDLTTPRPFGELTLDDVLTGVPATPGADGLCPRGELWAGPRGPKLEVRASGAFGQVVVFTPASRQAFCIEPYTCVTDAVNLEPQGLDTGLLVLPPGGKWSGVVEVAVAEDRGG
jgi:aldose 1-epimerase